MSRRWRWRLERGAGPTAIFDGTAIKRETEKAVEGGNEVAERGRLALLFILTSWQMDEKRKYSVELSIPL